MAETLDLLGTVYNLGGDSITAVLMYGRAIEFLRAVGNRSVLCSCLTMRASCAGPWGGDTTCTVNWSLAACERDLVEALQLAREIEWAAGEAFAEIYLRRGPCLLWTGGERAGACAAGTAPGDGDQSPAVDCWRARCAGTHLSVSACSRAGACLMRRLGSEVARALGSAFWIADLIAVQMQAYAALGQPKLAEAALQEVRSGAENPRLVSERSLLLAWAELALVQHQPDLALQRCEQLLSTAPQRAGETAERVIPRLWKCQGEALSALGRDRGGDPGLGGGQAWSEAAAVSAPALADRALAGASLPEAEAPGGGAAGVRRRASGDCSAFGEHRGPGAP